MNSWQLRCRIWLVNWRPPTMKICLSVLLELFDEADEVAVAADDHEGVDVGVGKRHLERVEREIDVGAVLVAAGRRVALHHADGVLRQHPAVAAGSLPVTIGHLRDDLTALFERVEHEAGVERKVQGVLEADFDVVEIDEYGNTSAFFSSHCPNCVMRATHRVRSSPPGVSRSGARLLLDRSLEPQWVATPESRWSQRPTRILILAYGLWPMAYSAFGLRPTVCSPVPAARRASRARFSRPGCAAGR